MKGLSWSRRSVVAKDWRRTGFQGFAFDPSNVSDEIVGIFSAELARRASSVRMVVGMKRPIRVGGGNHRAYILSVWTARECIPAFRLAMSSLLSPPGGEDFATRAHILGWLSFGDGKDPTFGARMAQFSFKQNRQQ